MSVIKDKHYISVKGTKGTYDELNDEDKEQFKSSINEFFNSTFDASVECLEVQYLRKNNDPYEATITVLLEDERPKETAEEANRINSIIADFVSDSFDFLTETEHTRLEGW